MLCCDWLFFNSSDWCISILAVHSVICSLGGPLSHGSPVVVFFDRGHPRFWNFYSTIPVDVVRVKSYMKCMLFTRKCHVVERSLMWQNGIWLVEYNSSTWKKLPYLHVVQWLGIFKLDFGRYFHSTWWNVSCLACVVRKGAGKTHLKLKIMYNKNKGEPFTSR